MVVYVISPKFLVPEAVSLCYRSIGELTMKTALYWIVPAVFSVFSVLAVGFPAQPPESPANLPLNDPPLQENPPPLPLTPAIPPGTIDKSDPLFQEFLKQIEKNGPSLKDPSDFPPHAKNESSRNPKELAGDAVDSNWKGSGNAAERRWFIIENLLRQARELKENATALRNAGLDEQSDRLEKTVQEIRQIALESAPAP